MAFGGVVFMLALPYLFGVVEEKYGGTKISLYSVRQDI